MDLSPLSPVKEMQLAPTAGWYLEGVGGPEKVGSKGNISFWRVLGGEEDISSLRVGEPEKKEGGREFWKRFWFSVGGVLGRKDSSEKGGEVVVGWGLGDWKEVMVSRFVMKLVLIGGEVGKTLVGGWF